MAWTLARTGSAVDPKSLPGRRPRLVRKPLSGTRYRMVGMTKSAPALVPEGHREVTVLVRV